LNKSLKNEIVYFEEKQSEIKDSK